VAKQDLTLVRVLEQGIRGPDFHATLFQARHGHYSGTSRATAEGTDFWRRLSAWMAKGA
jgi:hypothetical protein